MRRFQIAASISTCHHEGEHEGHEEFGNYYILISYFVLPSTLLRACFGIFVVKCLFQSSFTNLASCSSEGPSLKIPTKEASSELTGFDGREIRGAIKDIPVETAQAATLKHNLQARSVSCRLGIFVFGC
jgi:hypothetical protein